VILAVRQAEERAAQIKADAQSRAAAMLEQAEADARETLKNAEGTDTATAITQITKLFLASEVTIVPGSKIVVIHEGITGEYQRSGIPAVFPSHQEIMLTAFEGWA